MQQRNADCATVRRSAHCNNSGIELLRKCYIPLRTTTTTTTTTTTVTTTVTTTITTTTTTTTTLSYYDKYRYAFRRNFMPVLCRTSNGEKVRQQDYPAAAATTRQQTSNMKTRVHRWPKGQRKRWRAVNTISNGLR